MEKTKLITLNMEKDREKILKLRAISKGKTKSKFYREIIKDYLEKINGQNE